MYDFTELDKLKNIVDSKVEKADVAEENVSNLKLHAQIDAVYRLVNNTTRRIERSLQYIENKQNVIIKLLENSGVDVEEIEKQEKIKELEQQLNKLKGV
ncbi:MAG: hypothetical protein M0Q88_08440 [Bacilli bacterium]|nr:hypothetical protein [Bacilli bacterium]